MKKDKLDKADEFKGLGLPKNNTTRVFLNCKIDAELKQEFADLCKANNVHMSQVVEALLQKWCEANK